MQHDHVLKKLAFDPNPRVERGGGGVILTPTPASGGGGLCSKFLMIPFNLICNMTMFCVLKKLTFDLLTPSPGSRAALVIPFNLLI